MIEAVPRDPYGGYISDLLLVEKNMQLRRKRLHAVLRSNEIAPTTANFPMMGVEGYDHTLNKRGGVANSAYISDEVINPHPRFGTLTRNIRLRRLSNVNIRIPLGTSNINKLSPFVESSGEGVEWKIECCDDDKDLLRQEVRHEKDGQSDCDGLSSGATGAATAAATASSGADASTIHMDAMAFGMGCCCLQITMQVSHHHHACRSCPVSRHPTSTVSIGRFPHQSPSYLSFLTSLSSLHFRRFPYSLYSTAQLIALDQNILLHISSRHITSHHITLWASHS
jgi:glutamate--cysteine ligase catalytic subunit